MNVTYSRHARIRMRERNVTTDDVESVMAGRGAAHPSSRKRTQTGRMLSGRTIRVVYTETKAEEFHVVSVVIP